ncbi:hypothetical protein SFC82_06655 [Legionella pneumophila]|nr:hypothetical protein [Legionella pneumophila]
MIKYSGIGDQMTTGISDQVLRNTQIKTCGVLRWWSLIKGGAV